MMNRPNLHQRLAHLSRDSRDTLFLLAVVAWTLAPHASRLPGWASALAALALLWRATLAWTESPLPRRLWLTLVLAAAMGLTVLSHGTLLGQGPGLTLVVSLTALKTLELRARRDAFVVFFLGFFLILTQFMYSQSLLTALAMIVSIWGLLTALALAHLPAGRPPLRLAATLAGRAAVIGLPIMATLFMLFPRLGPLWGRVEDAPGQMGLSGRLQLGAVSELAQDDSIAMRVRFGAGPVPRPSALYFRGPVLSRYDGKEWLYAPPAGPDGTLRVAGEPITYELTIEPSRLSTVALLEASPGPAQITSAIPGLTLNTHGLGWRASQPLTDRVRVTTQAWTHFTHGPQQLTPTLHPDLELPPGAHPRSRQWLREQLSHQPRTTPRGVVDLLLRHIRTGGYSYTLAPGTYGNDGSDAIDSFWLDRKAGFCEHYAASMAVLLRSIGIPARIVTGYQGGELNPVDGLLVVRNRDAHAWVEFWQPGEGWVRADPTAAVSPERIERGLSLRLAPGLVGSALGQVNPAWAHYLRDSWDAANHRWNQWVLNYSQARQLDLLRRLGIEHANWQDLITLLVGVFSSVSLLVAAWAWWDRREHDPWLRTYARIVRALNRGGATALDTWPPLTLARYLHTHLGHSAEGLIRQLRELDAQRYGSPTRAHTISPRAAAAALHTARRLAASPAFGAAFRHPRPLTAPPTDHP